MMPPMMMAPIVVVAPGAVVADATRTIDGLYDTAARGRVISGIIVVWVIIIRIVVPNTSDKDAPEVVAVASEAMTAGECRPGTEPAAVNGRATVEAAATKAVSAATAMPSATMPATAADFDRQPVGCGFVRGGGARIDQRQRLCALAGGRQESQERSRRKAQESGQESR
jgi:hypothetical protein